MNHIIKCILCAAIVQTAILCESVVSRSIEVNTDPVRIAVAGLTHDHVHWLFGRDDIGDIEVVGIFEPNESLQRRYRDQYNLKPELFYNDLDEMLDSVQPDAVTAFGSTYQHLEIVESSSPRGIHVMVEKPLAVNMKHASRMKDLADKYNIHLITNYETTWYSSNHAVYDAFSKTNELGNIRKIVVHDGHMGPQEIGVSNEFLEWLIDPKLNGGGAIMDFGCYGANLITWLMNGEEPLSVTAVTQTHKPDIYGEVDDEATILLTYPGSQGVIQASWNWPYNRKDLHAYGEAGYIYAVNEREVRLLKNESQPVETKTLPSRPYPYDDPFSYLAGVVKGEIPVSETDLSSLTNNMTVVKILDSARESAQTGKTVYFDR